MKPGGRLLLTEQVNVVLTLLRPRRAAAALEAMAMDFNWWEANYSGLKDFLKVAGFTRVERKLIYRLKSRIPGQRRWHAAFEAQAPVQAAPDTEDQHR